MDAELKRFLKIRGLERAFRQGNFVRRIYQVSKGERCEVVLWDKGISFTVARSARGEAVCAGTLVFGESGDLSYSSVRKEAGQEEPIDASKFFERYVAFLHGEELPIQEGFW